MKIAFDVDGTLISLDNDQPRYEIIHILKALHAAGDHITVWSGGGRDYASLWVRRLGIEHVVDEVTTKPWLSKAEIGKNGYPTVIAFDDVEVELGHVNIRV